MAFTFAAFTYICALVIDAFLIFFAIFHVSRHSVSMVIVKLTSWLKLL